MSPRFARHVALALVVVFTFVAAACGGGGGEEVAPERVPDDLVPARMLDDEFGVFENTEESTVEALANSDESSLVADTRIWEVRRGDRLVGTVQISTVLPKVDLLDADVRDRFVNQVILGQQSRIRVGDVEVFTTTSNDKTVYLWFGENLFQIMQTKDRALEPEALLTDLIDFQKDKDGWRPLPELIDFE